MLAAVVLALALAMDAAAVAVVRGAVDRGVRRGVVFAALVGGFHLAMAGLGWVAGDAVGARIAAWDHWVAFALLAGLGVKMIAGARRIGTAAAPPPRLALYVMLALATSLDAAAAGLTLPLVGAPPAAIGIIGGVAAALAGLGYALGGRVAARVGSRLELAGGVVLIAVGTKILVEHLTA
jgi:putative Mn2+ efflux pump MntP